MTDMEGDIAKALCRRQYPYKEWGYLSQHERGELRCDAHELVRAIEDAGYQVVPQPIPLLYSNEDQA